MTRFAAAVVTAVILLVASATTQTASASTPHRTHPWGSTHAADQTLKQGCARYRYTYRVHPPTDEWMAEVFLVDKFGRGVGSNSFVSNADPARGRSAWRICGRSVVAGTYTIRMKVSWSDYREETVGWVPSSSFRLTRR